MSAFLRFADWQAVWLARTGGWLIVLLVFAMVYEVVARHIFNAPTIWAFEVAYMLSGTVFMFGIAFCQFLDAHIRVDFLYNRLGNRYRTVIASVTYLLFFLPGCIWLTWALGEYALESYLIGEHSGESAWNPIIWPFRLVWTIGFAALVLQGMAGLIRTFREGVPARRSAPGVIRHGH